MPDELTYDDSTRILKEVILSSTDTDPSDTPAEAAWRLKCYQQVQEGYRQGVMPTIPPD